MIYVILVIIKKIQGFWSCQWKSIGKMKDESNRKIITDFVSWKSKSYEVENVDGKENKKGKGVNSVIVNNTRLKNVSNFCLIKK